MKRKGREGEREREGKEKKSTKEKEGAKEKNERKGKENGQEGNAKELRNFGISLVIHDRGLSGVYILQ